MEFYLPTHPPIAEKSLDNDYRMKRELQHKYDNLLSCLRKAGKTAVAFSGGVDSTFLLKAASEVLPSGHILALTIHTPYIPEKEIEDARRTANDMNIRHIVLDSPVPEQVMNNPKDRCYICKTYLFSRMKEVAKQHGFKEVMEGTNADDELSYRPGIRALQESGIKSPLKECGLIKQDIRELSRIKGLATWDKPALACLLTRLPYNTAVDEAVLRRIEKSEQYLFGLGLRSVRVRVHGDLARIEAEKTSFPVIISDKLYEQICRQLKDYGFKFITLDMEGIRSGSFDN